MRRACAVSRSSFGGIDCRTVSSRRGEPETVRQLTVDGIPHPFPMPGSRPAFSRRWVKLPFTIVRYTGSSFPVHEILGIRPREKLFVLWAASQDLMDRDRMVVAITEENVKIARVFCGCNGGHKCDRVEKRCVGDRCIRCGRHHKTRVGW